MTRCKKNVHTGWKGLIQYQCKRNAIKDGYCWQHHPEAVKKREEHSDRKLAVTPFSMIHKY